MTGAVLARQSAAFRVVGGFLKRAVGVGRLRQTAHVVASELSAMAELIDGGALLTDRVVFDLSERAVGERCFLQMVQLVIFEVPGDGFELALSVGAQNGLCRPVAVIVIAERRLVSERVRL